MRTLRDVSCAICGGSIALEETEEGWFTLTRRADFVVDHALCYRPRNDIDLTQVELPEQRKPLWASPG